MVLPFPRLPCRSVATDQPLTVNPYLLPPMLRSTAHPYDPALITADRVPSDSYPRCYAAGVVVTYCGPNGRRGAVWRGSIKRSPNERAITASVPSHDGPDAAAVAVLQKAGLTWRLLPAASVDGGNRYCYAAERSSGEGAALAQGEKAVFAMHAAQLLTHESAPYGLALSVADMATGKRRPEPIVAGWIVGRPVESVTLTDHLGRDLFTLPDTFAPAHAMACARAAGFILSAESLDLAKRWTGELGQTAAPAGVEIAKQAREARL